jgi:hypothetical protein
MAYKIKCICTSIKEFSFNNNKIDKYISNEIIQSLNPENDDFIDNIIVLYKNNNKTTLKTLEIFCNRLLSKEEFEDYLIEMYNCGFCSKYNINIAFININNNEIIYNLDFNCLRNQTIKPYKYKKNMSTYIVSTIYTKTI